jgi:hypothetical protein
MTIETRTKRRVKTPLLRAVPDPGPLRAARRAAFRSARAFAPGGSEGPRSMLRIMRS